MGLFDKRDKKRGGKDDFDSPVEQIDLSKVAPAAAAPPPSPTTRAPEPSLPLSVTPPPATAATAAPAAAAKPASAPAPAPAPAPAARAAASSSDGDDYGIERAIELMRTLPSENVELVVQVVKFSLESVGIKLPAIIEDAIRRQKDIQGRIGVLKGEIHDLEQEIKQRKEEIDRLEADHKETSMVRDRLELAENLGKPPKTDATTPSAVSASGSLPRMTRQTGAPPVSGSTTSAPSPTSPTAPPTAGAPIKK